MSEPQQILCARVALRRHGGVTQDENGCACEHCVALRELIDMVRALPAPEPPRLVPTILTVELDSLEQRVWRLQNGDDRQYAPLLVKDLLALARKLAGREEFSDA